MAGIFKAYDVRGIYPTQIDEEIARQIGRAFRTCSTPPTSPTAASGWSSRATCAPPRCRSSAALIEGLRAAGLDVVDIGLATTPMNYFAIGHLERPAACRSPPRTTRPSTTASSSRSTRRGRSRATTASRCSSERSRPAASPPASRRGDLERPTSPPPTASTSSPSSTARRDARRLKVVVDAANGMAVVDRTILEALGVELVPLFFELDGTFPNHEANPLKLENLRDLQARVRETGADLGVACDGDFDRAAFVDEKGEPVGSDLATALIAGELLAHDPGKARALRPALLARGARVHPREGRRAGARAGRPLLHEGDAARAATASSAASSPATTTSATTSTPTARWPP